MTAVRQHVIVEVEHFDAAIGMLGDQLDGVREEIRTLKEHQADAMASALRSVLTDKETLAKVMDIVVDTAQQRAAEKTGNAVGAMVKSLLTRWVVIGCIVVIVAKTAGVDVAGKVWASLKGLP
jgi:uncharacterized membrane-anchored protein YjiN (DUF445 family)